MADYLWEYSGFGPRVGVSKESPDSIFVRGDKKRLYKAWWNGCGISDTTKTLEESKKIALEYVRDYVIVEKEKAVKLIGSAAVALAEIEKQLAASPKG